MMKVEDDVVVEAGESKGCPHSALVSLRVMMTPPHRRTA